MVKGKTAATGQTTLVFLLLTNKDKNSEGYPTGSWRICWNLLTSRTHNGGGCGFETAYSKTTIWGFKINPCFLVKISQWFCENQSAILVKLECDFGKVGVWFCENQPVMLRKAASGFCENRSAILVKSEPDFGKVGVWFCENQPVMFWKSEWDFLAKSEYGFCKVGVWFWIDTILPTTIPYILLHTLPYTIPTIFLFT